MGESIQNMGGGRVVLEERTIWYRRLPSLDYAPVSSLCALACFLEDDINAYMLV